MTPWQLSVYADGFRSADLRRVWHAEALRRMEKLMPLAELLNGIQPKPGIDENDIKSRLMAHNKRIGA